MNETVLETHNLTRYYGSAAAVDHLNLKVPRGCICGFIGRNGAGKTTAIKLMLGLLEPTAGSSSLLGCDSAALTPAIRQRIGYVTEGHRLFRWMTISELENFQAAFFPRQWDRKLFAEMIEYFELAKKRKIKHLSNGQRAQVSLALALAPKPELLIMDDPTLGLDAAIRRQFLEGMIELIMRQGRTVLFSSHILADVERVADRIAVIDKGRLRASCSLEEFRSAVRKVVFTFADSPPAQVDIDGLLHCRRSDKQLELTLVGADDFEVAAWAEAVNALEHHTAKMNLEDQFIEFTAPANRRKLFQWEET
ncbi:MAG: ABC transporter ATP-binding protein [Sedimentisphaerales bacterium]|nr:ABC transporter ATP-binding protein [Sedimentisphaerales bacterium]